MLTNLPPTPCPDVRFEPGQRHTGLTVCRKWSLNMPCRLLWVLRSLNIANNVLTSSASHFYFHFLLTKANKKRLSAQEKIPPQQQVTSDLLTSATDICYLTRVILTMSVYGWYGLHCLTCKPYHKTACAPGCTTSTALRSTHRYRDTA